MCTSHKGIEFPSRVIASERGERLRKGMEKSQRSEGRTAAMETIHFIKKLLRSELQTGLGSPRRNKDKGNLACSDSVRTQDSCKSL